MSGDDTIQDRLTALETAVAEIRSRLPAAADDWIARFTGIFKDEPAFDEVIAHGRSIRQADRPREDQGS